MAASNDKSNDTNPTWLDQVLGTASPPFSFRKGGSIITGGGANDPSGQQSASKAGADKPKGRQRR